MSFSHDVVPGVRLNMAGKPTEDVVLKNLYLLRRQGIQMSGIAVLAKHTVDRVTDVYDFYARHGMGMRILPLFDGPDERPSEHFMVDHPTIIRAWSVCSGTGLPRVRESRYVRSTCTSRRLCATWRGSK
jgi:uncharacterized protein